MAGEHSRPVEGGRGVWQAERLWALARELPVREVPIDSIAEFDQNCWFRPQTPPTCRAVAEHARRIINADLTYPVILAADGGLMDGGHRIAKAWLLGHTTIAAAQFEQTPEPDYVVTKTDYVIDGENFLTLEGFYDEIWRVVIPELGYPIRSLDTLNDILHGGFGTPDEGFTLIWQHSALSRVRLGYRETARRYRGLLHTCHPSNRDHVRANLHRAEHEQGATLFDEIIEIIRDYEHITLRLA